MPSAEASATTCVQRCWEALASRSGCHGAASAAVLDGLMRAYAEPHRHCHTLDHIAALLMLLDGHTDAGSRGVADRRRIVEQDGEGERSVVAGAPLTVATREPPLKINALSVD